MATRKPTTKGPGKPGPDGDVERALASQRAWLIGIATKIEGDEPLTRLERAAAALVLRRQAERTPSELPRSRGQAPAFDGAAAALRYYGRKLAGNPISRQDLAEECGVSVEALGKALRKYGEQARSLCAMPGAVFTEATLEPKRRS